MKRTDKTLAAWVIAVAILFSTVSAMATIGWVLLAPRPITERVAVTKTIDHRYLDPERVHPPWQAKVEVNWRVKTHQDRPSYSYRIFRLEGSDQGLWADEKSDRWIKNEGYWTKALEKRGYKILKLAMTTANQITFIDQLAQVGEEDGRMVTYAITTRAKTLNQRVIEGLSKGEINECQPIFVRVEIPSR
mgnify:CR=1 FL=1